MQKGVLDIVSDLKYSKFGDHLSWMSGEAKVEVETSFRVYTAAVFNKSLVIVIGYYEDFVSGNNAIIYNQNGSIKECVPLPFSNSSFKCFADVDIKSDTVEFLIETSDRSTLSIGYDIMESKYIGEPRMLR